MRNNLKSEYASVFEFQETITESVRASPLVMYLVFPSSLRPELMLCIDYLSNCV